MLEGDLLIVDICQEFGWDYWTYLQQPSWFIEMIVEKRNIDAKKSE